VCQVPDYRKIAPANHADLIAGLYAHLTRNGVVPDDWFARQVAFADRVDGDIDTLANRIAHIRTWTFVANRGDWLADPAHWQGVTRGVEDRLSDALHDRLTQRFVDRRTSVLMRRLRENAMLEAEITSAGDVLVEGQHVGQLQGFRFAPDPSADGPDVKALRTAAQKALASELTQRADRLSRGANEDFALASDGALRWHGEIVGRVISGETVLTPGLIVLCEDSLDAADRLSRGANEDFALASDGALRWHGEIVGRVISGETVLTPGLIVLCEDSLDAADREKVEARLVLWLRTHIDTVLKPLRDLEIGEGLEGLARGIAFRLVEALGILERSEIAEDVRQLDQTMRAGLRRLGVRFGAYHIFVPALLKPAPSRLIAQLWALKHGEPDMPGLSELPQLSASGRTSITVDPEISKALYKVVGFRVCGPRAVRIDILERLADLIRPLLAWKPLDAEVAPPEGAVAEGGGFTVTVAMTSLLGCAGEDFSAVLKSLGYRSETREVTRPVAATADAAAPEAPVSETPVVEAQAETETSADEQTAAPVDAEPEAAEAAAAPAEPDAEAHAGAADAIASETTPAETATETVAIEIWRPGRRDRRPQGAQRGGRRQEAAGGDAAESQGQGQKQRTKGRGFGKGGNRQQGRPDQQRSGGGGGKGRNEGSRPDNQRPRGTRPERPAREMDPDSPFAKLAALKADLEKKPRS
jgi:ATP-dependent RNA helicase SUPV3L1/SUV3